MRNRLRKWMLMVGIALGALVGGVFAVGFLLPERHVAARYVVLAQPPMVVWTTITDFANAAEWRPDISKVESGTDPTGRDVWVEIDTDGGKIPYATLESIEPTRLVREIADPELGFGGTWTFELEPLTTDSEVEATRVTITERGFVPNPAIRAISAFLIGHTTFIERYLTALGRKFGEAVEPLPVQGTG